MGSWNVTSERVFAQDTDPGAVGAGAIWSDTNANITYRRNDANTDWIPTTISLGTARQVLAVNSGATALEYVASMQSLLTAQGDVIYASGANTPARLAKGTGLHVLRMNSGATAPEWAALSSSYEVLDNHTASGTEASYTYTPGAALDFATYSKIIIEFMGSSTATFTLQLVLNGIVGTDNFARGFYVDGSAITHRNVGSTSSMELCLNTVNGAGNLFGTTEICSKVTALTCKSMYTCSGTDSSQYMNGTSVGATTVTSIKLQTSTSTWTTGTRITIYGVKTT